VSDEHGVLGRAGAVTMGRSLYVASLFVLNIGLARAMGPESFGAFQQVFIFNALFLILTLGIPETVYYFIPRLSGVERSRFLGQTFGLLLASGLFTAVLFAAAAPLFAGLQQNREIVQQLRMFGIFGGFFVAASFADPVFITYKRTSYVFLLNTFHGIFLFGLTAWYYAAGVSSLKLFTAMAVFGALKYLLTLILLFSIRREIGPVSIFSGKNTIPAQLTFAIPIILTTTVDIVSRWLDKFVVSSFFGAETFGVFFVGAIEIPFIAVLVASVYSVISPLLNSFHHKGEMDKLIRLVNTTFKLLAKIVWPLFIYCFVFAGLLITVVFRENFAGAVLPFRIYLMLVPLRIASYGIILIALGKPQTVFRAAVLALLLNLVLNIVLAMTIGYVGPALATVISTYFHVFILIVVILRQTGASLSDLVPFRQLIAIAITGGFAVLIAFTLSMAVQGDIAKLALSAPAFALSYLILGRQAGILRLSDFLIFFGGSAGGKEA